MKRKLRQIYIDLSNGKLSQQEAFEKIKAIKLRGQRIGALLVTPFWQASDVEAPDEAGQLEYAEHHVILCELSKVDARELGASVPHSNCLSLQAANQKNIAERYSEYALACFERIQAILQGKSRGKALVQIVIGNHQEQALFAGLAGLLKTAALENPRLIGQLILVPTQTTAEGLGQLLREEKTSMPIAGLDPLIRYEQGARQVFGWQEVAEDLETPPIAFKDQGVYLIAGGLGGLGLLFAREILAEARHARVVLTGRSAPGAGKQSLLDGLSAPEGRLSYRQVDLGDPDQVERLIAGIQDECGQLNGIIHCAGTIADNFILKKTGGEFREVLAPKVTGTYNLDQASQDVDLDFFALFSSIASVMGNVGQADYATANGFMDQFAAYRNRQVATGERRGRTLSINWPLWQAGGMRIDPASEELLRQTTGLQPMRTATGLQAFYRGLAAPYDQLLVVEGDLTQIRRALLAGRPIQPELAPLVTAVEQSVAPETDAATIDSDSLVEKTQDYLRRELSEQLKLPSNKIDPQAALEKYGIDSILAMKLTNQLEKTFGSLPKTLFFEYQTISELSEYFTQSHSARLATLFPAMGNGYHQLKPVDTQPEMRPRAHARRDSGRRVGRLRSTPGSATDTDPIAIIGLSGRYPEAVDIEAYWRNLREGKDCIIEVPKERWVWREYFSEDRSQSGRHYSKWGGFIAGVDEFDPLFFNMAPKEAKYIDPQERLFLQHVWMAIEDAGYTRASLQTSSEQDLSGERDLAGQVGVYVGVMYSEYQLFGAESSMQGKRLGIAASVASIANRVSYALNLHGPSMTLDTMCSSSLTAIHLACQDLTLGRTSLAIAGGVNVSIHPNKYLALSAGQFISSDGHCQSFGEGGDGYIPGEGVGVVVLKRLSDAQRDGDHIYGVIRGSALNHGGKTNGYTVPNPQAQAAAISRALAESRTDARHISYIEAHGTGTKLGDPIEIAALSKAFQQYTQETGFCLIGSVKSNIGHCESAAGIAGLTKVLLQMRRRQIAPSLHSTRLNSHIDFAKTPFVVNQELRPWEQPVIEGQTLPRIAGISSFGAGGSNAHLIVEEYQEPTQEPMAFANFVILLSARTAEQLRQKARDLLDYVRPRLSEIDLVGMAYTLQVGREAMEERLGFLASSVEQLAEKLEAYAAGEEGIEGVYRGQASRNKEALSLFSAEDDLRQTIDRWIASKKLSKLVELWVKGLELDWGKLYGEVKPRRISLPTYPFAKDRYWVDTAPSAALSAVMGGRVVASVAPAVLHPLLHSNTSDLTHQRYSSSFSGEEFFLKDHQVNGQRILPSAAYLEMARIAVTKAANASHETVLELRDVVWAQPIVGAQHKQISIALLAHDHDEIGYEIYSQEADEETVHCQGRAVLSRGPASARLDLEQLKQQVERRQLEPSSIYAACARMGLIYGPSFQGIAAIHRHSDQILAQLRLPRTVEDTSGDYWLHPSLVDSALQACVVLIDGTPELPNQPRLPLAMESLRIVSACNRAMVAWVRYSPGSQAVDSSIKLDIDLCDEQGNVCAQMRGLSWQPASLDLIEPILEKGASPPGGAMVSDGALAAPAHKEIVLAPSLRAPAPVERKKPAAIALASPSIRVSAAAAPSANTRAPITLSIPGAALPGGIAPIVPSVLVYDDENGIFSIEIAAPLSDTIQPKDVIAQLLRALDRVQQEASVKALIISGPERCFPRGGREDFNDAIDQDLYQTIVSFPYPVIAVIEGDAIGAGFLFAALCDFMVCNEDAIYGFTDARRHLYPTTSEAILMSERFGEIRAHDLLYLSTASTGRRLRTKGWTCPLLPATQVGAYAQKLASALATKSQEALRLLKQHLTRSLVSLVGGLTRVEAAAGETEHSSERAETGAKTIASSAAHLHLDSPAEHVLVIRFHVAQGVTDLVADLGQVFSQIHQAGYYKAIVLVSEDSDLLPGTEQAISRGALEDVVLDFQRLFVGSEIPVVAALAGNARGAAWLISQFCDACVYSQTGVYSSADLGQSSVLAQTAAAIFTHRFGKDAGKEILLSGADYSGDDLQQRAGALIVAARDEVLPKAIQLAEVWAKLPRPMMAAWKQHTTTTLQEKIRNLPVEREPKDDTHRSLTSEPISIRLQSKVVTLTAHPEGIAVVKMEDREAKNMFSDALIEGIREAFAHIEQTPAYKVVILTGYDSYFASGGTKESLLAIGQGKAKFTDFKIFQAPLDCPLPVIAAMQGHAIGAGWTLGLFADLILLSEESRYLSPYMDYGFTPGAGATYILADKLGQDLARESLLTGRYCAGSELKARGLLLPIMPRAEAYPAAMALARQITRISRGCLIGLKQQLTGYVHEPLEDSYRLELAMHEKTFVGRSDTLAQIQNRFYPATDASPAVKQQSEDEVATPSVNGDALPAIITMLKMLLADELQMRENELDENVEFVDLGLDSISGVAWIRKINEKYQTSIEATKVYSYPTLTRLGRYVKEEAEKHGALSRPGATPAAPSEGSPLSRSATVTKYAVKKLASWRSRTSTRGAGATSTYSSQPIALIGMAGQFPQAKNLEEFWQNIAEGRNCITQVPSHRWDVHAYYQPGAAVAGRTNSQWIGALEEYDLFDPLFFNISPTEAESMDPQQRLFLQTCWHTIENAGYDARVLSGSKCGVFVGCAAGDYHQLSRKHQLSAHGFTGGATSILAARISFFLNLQGPCISIDTACSSSLVALAQACDSLTSGASDLALAGGVYVMAGPEMHIKASQAGMLSPEGRCFTFDERANGFVPGEGVGVVLLKRLADAERDRDMIHAVIHGWGVNQDGRTNGITAPNPESQTRLEQEVYDKFGIDPASVQLIEAHGTGTKLGDPIEVEGLRNAFKKYTQKKGYCALGSVKSNIGHCLTAAGIAGALKLILALKRKQLPPTINFERVNEHIALTDSPFYVNARLQEWDLQGADRRQAAISSFGFSGTNAHMVIGEYTPPAEVKRPVAVVTQNTKAIIPLSASTAEQLKLKARDLLDFIQEAQSIDLIEMAYTLQVGRQPMDERLGFVASSVEQLAEKLQAYLTGERGIEDAYQGQALRDNDTLSLFSADADLQHTIDRWIANKKLSKLLELWVKGLDLDWSKLYGEVKPQRVSLPTYPFAKERYWIDTAAPREEAIGALLAAPVWRESDIEVSAGASHIECAEHHVVLCELSDVKQLRGLLPHVHCLSLQAERQNNIAQRYSEYALACFERIQAILQGKPQGKALVQIVVADHQEQSLLAGLSGLLKTAALENPQLIGQLILAPPEITTEELATYLQAEQSHTPDPLIRYEQGARQVLHWQEAPAEQDKPPIAFKDHGVYLITGGLGGLGLLFAKEILAETRQARVVLTGRSALTPEKQARLEGLSAQTGRVSYRRLDLGNLDQVKRLIAAIQDEYGQLDGILHCAGMMITDNIILKKANAEFSQVLAPKVAGAYNLDQASQDVELDFFVLFSSIASATGNPGTADYATANGFMDQFAAYRNRQVAAGGRHGRTRSINWPLWQAGGMRIDQASQERLQQTTGMQPMRTATGLEAFYRSLTLPYDQILVVEGIRPKITAYYLQKARIFEPSSNTETVHDQSHARVLNESAGAPPDKLSNVETQVSLNQLQQRIKTILATTLGVKTSIDMDQAFVELGLDSFLGTELVIAINKAYGTGLSNITVFDYPTVRKLALFLEQEIKKLPGYSKQAPAGPLVRPPLPVVGSNAGLKRKIRVARTTTSNQALSDDKIAIIGMSGRYPQANSLQEYWDNLVEGRNSIVEVPPSRWDANRYYDPAPAKKDKANSKWLGALDDIDCFDPLFFRISPQEANYIDPHHRLFLQESYKAFEDAGYSSDALSNKKCGVYLGISANEYALLLSKNRMLGGAPVTSNHPAIAAARIAYYLNLKGPAISVDTACSSSLVAVHLACQGLLSREIDMALAGGVTLWLTPESYLSMSQAGMLSAVGQCKAFDDTADGIVVGDGVGALVLKRLKDAEADNDFIYGVILGSGVNQDGKTNGITAPSTGSQIELEREIYTRNKIDPETISYVETHGTGTRLGDPIELEALATVFKEKTTKKQYCALGSVKSNIGHTTSAAGVAGVQKVLLSMRHRTLVPSLNVTKETSRFDFKNSPFYIVRETKTWDAAPGSLRRAAVSSFGFSGTNAHLVVEEYAPPLEQAVWSGENASFIVPLSARTAEQLEEKARDLLKFIRASQQHGQPAEQSTPSSNPIDLADMAYTLQVGRDAMEERLGFVVSSVGQLAEKLSAYLNGEENIESAYQCRVEPGAERLTTMKYDDDMKEVIGRWIARKKLGKLAQSWTRGLNVDWNKLYGEAAPRRISLPAYPFAKERCWIAETPIRHSVESRFEFEGALKSIDDIMDKICDDAMETDQAVKLLKALV